MEDVGQVQNSGNYPVDRAIAQKVEEILGT
jgi:hypothetical protein